MAEDPPAAGSNGRPGHQLGMTIIEVVIVLGLLAIATLFATVNLPEFNRRYQLEAEVRQLTAFLREAPTEARDNNTPVFLTWDSGDRKFVMSIDFAATQVIDTFAISDDITITGPADTVLRCDLYGRAFVGTATTMMTTTQSISLTHTHNSHLNFQLTLTPLWTVETGSL